MGSVPVAARLLESLPPRPPTPPRETSHELLSHPKPTLSSQPSDPLLSLQTPPNVHDPDSTSSSNSRRKKVGFSAEAEYKEAPVYVEGDASRTHPTPVSLPSSSSRPAKSILKATSPSHPLDPLTGTYFDVSNPSQINIVTMLDSTILQLAGADRSQKLDAYMMLVRALKASNNLPDRIALQDKMSLFTQFIQRDITTKTSDGSIDSTLVNHALNLLSTFLHFPAIASTLSNDFGVFIIDHCIRCFEDRSVPKDVVRHLMQVNALQNFPPKVMTSDRVGRLVAALHKIEEHLRGKSIIVSRTLIYRKLVKQCNQMMLSHPVWVEDLFTDMLSSMKEIRSSAIALGLDAAFTLGKDKTMGRRTLEVLQRTLNERSYAEYYAERLNRMIKEKSESASVPQIWSVVMLLHPRPDRWNLFQSWLKIIQNCFNNIDHHTKQEANFAWCRLIYRTSLDERAFESMLDTLIMPLASQLRRHNATRKHADDLRKVILGSFCNIFYYAFKPNTNLAFLDDYWAKSVRPLIQQLLDRNREGWEENTSQAIIILAGLFDSTTPRLWREDHVMEQPLVRPDELPAIDVKWLRRNTTEVFGVIEPILENNFLELSKPASHTYRMWHALVGSVASAASKEIKVSPDTANFVAHAFTVLAKIWAKGMGGDEVHDAATVLGFLNGVEEYIRILVDSLGLLPFTEKLLSMTKQNSFIPVSTPSHRLNKGQSLARTPLIHLFSVLSCLPPGVSDDDNFASFIRSVFEPFFSVKGDKARMDLAQELLQTLPMEALCPYGPWLLVAEKTTVTPEPSQHSHQTAGSGSEIPLGPEFRSVVRVLERGLRSIPNLPWKYWGSPFHAFSDRVRDETGDAGLAIIAIEPLSRSILDVISSRPEDDIAANHINAAIALISASTQPRDRQAVEAAKRRLWGTSLAGPKTASFDPLEQMYKLLSMVLEHLYDHFAHYDADHSVVPILKEIGTFFDRCNNQLVVRALFLLQNGISRWIEDGEGRLNSRQFPAVIESTNRLFEKICNIWSDLDRPDQMLNDAETIFCAAFQSKHRLVVNTVSTAWNRTFNDVAEIEYPQKLKDVLIKVHSFVDIVLPGLDVSTSASGSRQPAFIESQDEATNLARFSSPRSVKPRSRPSSSHRSSPGLVKLSVTHRHHPDTPPTTKLSKPLRRSATPKLRHDDSQIQFAAIESSPTPAVVESQVLTDRQREVRERQQENVALFPAIRSSPAAGKNQELLPVNSPSPKKISKTPGKDRAATPEPDGGYEDYITSTPTPRRGQPLPLPDHDMVDPPSSPPEPRSHLLLSELKSRSNSNSLLDEWQFSSSPIQGSPNPSHHMDQLAQPMGLDEINDKLQLDEGDASDDDDILQANMEDGEGIAGQALEPELDILDHSEPIGENLATEQLPANSLPIQRGERMVPSTPTHNLRSMTTQGSGKSDQEVFVDAPTSPLPPTPRHRVRSNQPTPLRASATTKTANQSFEISDADERSMMRIVVQLESRKCDPASSHQATEDVKSQKQTANDEPEILDCITVGGEKKKGRGRQRKSKSANNSQTIPSTPVDDEAMSSSQDKPLSEKSDKKRKRSSSRLKDLDSKKKRKSLEPSDDGAQVSDSQAAHITQDLGSRPADILYEAEVADVSTEISSQVSPIVPQAPEFSQASEAVMEVDEVHTDEEVQSQLVSEQHAADATEAPNNEEGVTAPDVPMELTVTREPEITDREEANTNTTESAEPQDSEPLQERSKFQVLMDLFKGAHDALRTMSLSREEVKQVEDQFYDIKREMYDAELRGRQ